ncbi:FtsK/SpoIIIE domain-containing protein [Listeria welshimeri]|uniref:FtsK/SpoIIIE domain-containing protein n=1 Tax=Listeria welshimeri TaxID=1643 RepID=UPI001D035283|nr:FtsK/SpoIIIE domain-containing protein [Listeria welshimeri]
MPPLEERISLESISTVDFEASWQKDEKSLELTLGVLDQPQLQAQNVLHWNLEKNGHMAVFSSPGFGKSTFMQTAIFDLARKNTPEFFHAYLLDFGTNGLLSLKGLPHVADTFSIDETEKTLKLVRLLSREIKERKQLLSKFSVASLKMYEEISGDKKPIILLAIDNYDAIREVDEFVANLEPTIV